MILAASATIQFLSAVHDAVRDALKAAANALTADGPNATRDAQQQWHSAHAALQVVDHAGLVKFSAELGALIAGRRDQPLRLWPAYDAMQRARGVAQPSESDLFFPDLNVGPVDVAPGAALTADDLRGVRRAFEAGLLQWLRKSDSAALKQINAAVTHVETAQTSPRTHRLWWIARAVIDALLHDGLSIDAAVRRLLTQLNLYIGRMLQGPVEPSDALLRDALFLAARAKPVTPLVETVQETCRLKGALDLEDTTPPGFGGDALATARKHMHGLQDLWGNCAAGNAGFADFEHQAHALAGACAPLGDVSLNALTAQLAEASGHLAKAGSTLPVATRDAAVLEGACATLMIEHVLAADHAPDAAFAERAANMAARLRVALESPQALAALPPARLLDEAAQQAHWAQHESQARTEIKRDLHDIEVALERWFCNHGNLELISGLDKPLKRIGGAFALLGHDDAAAVAAQCRDDVARYAQGERCGEAEGQLLSRRVTLLSTFSDELQHGSVDLEQLASRLIITLPLPRVSAASALPAIEVPPVAVTPAPAEAFTEVSTDAPVLFELPKIDFVPLPAPEPAAPVALAPVAPVEPVPATAVPIDNAGDTDAEMFEIFAEEASEVLQTIADTVPQSRAEPQDQEKLTTLRRAFHTLKGSGPMVGLKHLGEAAWEIEQVFNEMSPQQRPGTADLYRLVEHAHGRFAHWIGELRAQQKAAIDAAQLTDWARRVRAGDALPEAAPATVPEPTVSAPPPAPR